VTNNSRVAKGRSYSGSGQPRGNLGNATIMDVNNVLKHIAQEQRPSPATFLRNGADLPIEEVKAKIREIMDSGHLHVHIYWFGHGEDSTGNWCFEDSSGNIGPTLSLHDLLDMWKIRKNAPPGPGQLHLLCDCCHSGAWVDEAERMNLANVWIITACRSTELARQDESGGDFTVQWVNDWHIKRKLHICCDTGLPGGKQHPQHWDGGHRRRRGL